MFLLALLYLVILQDFVYVILMVGILNKNKKPIEIQNQTKYLTFYLIDNLSKQRSPTA